MFLKTNKILSLGLLAMGLLLAMPTSSKASVPTLQDLQYVEVKSTVKDPLKGESDFSARIRRDAMREAALSYGARGGLASRTQEIMSKLDDSAVALDKTYDFRRLLITAPSNLLIEPPIISEALGAFHVSALGDEAAVSDVIYNISRQARIVAAPRTWRQYLERSFDTEIAPPPDLLLPENQDERASWVVWVAEGWEEGQLQADEIFQADLNRLVADFEGMVRYRMLLMEGKVSSPYAVHEDRGVTGGGDQMRIGDRAIRISGPAQLRNAEDTWNPANR